MNSIASIATVATGPCASRLAMMPAAMSIWLSTQPPKIWPLALMSDGPGTTLSIGSPRFSLIVVVPVSAIRFVVMAGAIAEKDEPHQARSDEHGQPDPGDRGDHHVNAHRIAEAFEPDQREQDGDDRGQHHPAHDRPVACPGGGRALVIGPAIGGNGLVPGHGCPSAFASGIIKGPSRVRQKGA